jgi:hypothetical protein
MHALLLNLILLQAVPPRALVLAMLLSYAMCFAGLAFAYVNYRRRQKHEPPKKDDDKK